MKKPFWTIVAILSAIYILTPEPSDLIPVIGWLDEATALAILNFALKQLGINLFEKFFGNNTKESKTIIIDKKK